MTPDAFRKLALSFPEACEGSHMRHADFRVGGKVFATLGYPSAEHGCIMLAPEEQEVFMAESPAIFAPANGSWGLKGATVVRLKPARTAVVKSALLAAWRRRAPKGVTDPVAAKKAAKLKR